MKQKILLSFNGDQDPYGRYGDGPILSLLSEKQDYDKIILFHTENRVANAQETKDAIKAKYPRIETELALALSNPTDYAELIGAPHYGNQTKIWSKP